MELGGQDPKFLAKDTMILTSKSCGKETSSYFYQGQYARMWRKACSFRDQYEDFKDLGPKLLE
jgi:peroxiredoxin